MTNKVIIKLTWEQCKAISHYYQFQTVVFLLPEKHMLRKLKDKTRNAAIGEGIEKIRKKLDNIAEELKMVL